jgi:D-alanyl-D-alanine carboxypeptidase
MAMMRIEARNGLRWGVVSLAAIVAVLTITSDAADARHHRRLRVHYVSAHHVARVHHAARAEDYSPPSASIVIDGNTGAVLQASNPDAPRHPASLTKIMTLYLLFERLDAGKIKLDTPLKVSEHASDQDPTKLDLKPGQTIPVEDAIKGVVTRSANDAAVVIAESIGGSEDEFAKLMTQKAHALGMSRTTYVNASGLPDDDQITTARDQALLGRAIQDRFPRYYKYFSLPAFVYHGVAIRNHDHLLGQVEGVDGIKTGFTRASGFNLVTSVHRDGRYVVAVVLGGRSGFQRDAHMRELISEHIKEASLQRTAPVIAEQAAPHDEPQPAAVAKTSTVPRAADPTPTATVTARAAAGSNDPIQPLLVKTVSYRIAPVQPAPLAPMPALVAAPAPQPEAPRIVVASADTVPPVTIPAVKSDPIKPEATKPDVAKTEVPKTEVPKAEVPKAEVPKAEVPKAEVPKAEVPKAEVPKIEVATTAPASAEPAKPEPTAQVRARGGWLIQIGAYPGEDEAKQHLSAARSKVRDKQLAAADPFTERVLKGDKALYRARFAGFDKATADATCKQLKRNDFDCITVKN